MGTTRIVIDTNVLVSAFGWAGKPKQVFDQVLDGRFELIISQKQLAEIKRVITYPRLKFTADEQMRFLDILTMTACVVETHNDINIIKDDPSDNTLLEAAVEHKATHVISGDQHLLKLKEFRGIRIIKPDEFLRRQPV
ncbi:putative toxin-antitoxin system toxin component, PIN family [Candidatus Woesearchaeota archaeon]|nr:putative toxin-antitoxin system toxin component, PIN family [Candidatus Woesearchaeota archaeon]